MAAGHGVANQRQQAQRSVPDADDDVAPGRPLTQVSGTLGQPVTFRLPEAFGSFTKTASGRREGSVLRQPRSQSPDRPTPLGSKAV
ncbi:hypothetical protein Ct61P_08474 [Colletotrichum tofieldiae]|nr:hypothetical protein Ct61P_08474 [Colletotrichum tofieldiae]